MSLPSTPQAEKRTKLWVGIAALVFVVFISLGVMASNGWLPATDPLTGKNSAGSDCKTQPKNGQCPSGTGVPP